MSIGLAVLYGPEIYAAQCILSGEEKPQNYLFPLGFRHPAGGGSSHGHMQHAHKFGKDRACGSGYILADRQTDRQTHTHTDVVITVLRISGDNNSSAITARTTK